MSDKITVELTEAEIRAMLDDDGSFDDRLSAAHALRAALPVEYPIGTVAWITPANGERFGPMHRVGLGWSARPDGPTHRIDAVVTKVEPVKIVPADHISIPRSAVDGLTPNHWREQAPPGCGVWHRAHLAIADALGAADGVTS